MIRRETLTPNMAVTCILTIYRFIINTSQIIYVKNKTEITQNIAIIKVTYQKWERDFQLGFLWFNSICTCFLQKNPFILRM